MTHKSEQKKIILHAGAPKTGSTSLQHALGNIEDMLQENRIYFPERLVSKKRIAPIHIALRNLYVAGKTEYAITQGRIILEELFKKYDTIIISKEDVLMDLFPEGTMKTVFVSLQERLSLLETFFAGYPVTAFYTVRRWQSWLPSFYFQLVRRGETRSFKAYLNDLPAAEIDWRIPVQGLVKIFGAENCYIFHHEDLKKNQTLLLTEMLRAAGISDPKTATVPRVNKTYGVGAIAYMRFWNRVLSIKKRSLKTRKFVRYRIYPWLTGWLAYSPRLKCPPNITHILNALYDNQIKEIKKIKGIHLAHPLDLSHKSIAPERDQKF